MDLVHTADGSSCTITLAIAQCLTSTQKALRAVPPKIGNLHRSCRIFHRDSWYDNPVAHWNDERDRMRVQMMRECNLPGGDEIIDEYEKTGDELYWARFCDLIGEYLRACKLT